jgi:hypothetical protein
LFLLASFVSAQTFRGGIQGTVSDASGAAIPSVKVKILAPGTGLTRTVTTNELGAYVASELPLGIYNITVEKSGFRSMTLTGISVSVGAPARADIKLQTGAVEEKIEVTAEVPLVETASNSTGGTIEAAQAAELPINGRDYTKLVELVPGSTSDPNGSTESAGSYGLFSLNGNRGRSNNYLIDGTDMNDGYRNLPSINQAGVWGAPSTILPVDALAEIPVSGNTEAEFGRSSGATVNIVTKSGTNQIHGSFSESYRNDSMSARNFFNTASQPKNSFTNHQFGGAVGGPIFKDKTFYFLAYEGQREDGSLPQLGTVPTQNAINTYTAAGNTINPVIQKILDTKPWGTLPQSESSVTFTTPFRNSSDNVIVKADHHAHILSAGDLFTGRYFYSHGMQNFPLGMLYTGSSAPGFNTLTPTHVNIASLSYTSVPRSNIIFELRGGYNRFVQQFLPTDNSLNPETAFGLNTLPDSYSVHDLGLPTINVSGLSPIGSTASDSRGRVDTNYQLFSNVSIVEGRHSFKVGAEWRRTFINSFINSGHRGKLGFSSLDHFLAGTMDSGFSADGDGTRYSYQNGGGAYLLDSWHLTSKLTLNYGLRWDYYGVIGAKNKAFSIFNTKTGKLETIGDSGAPSSIYPKDWNNFAPRFSLADDLFGNGKLVLRTGAGIYYDGPSQDFFVGNQAYNTYAADAGPAFNGIGIGSMTKNITGNTSQHQIHSDEAVYGNYQPSAVFTVDQKLTTPTYYAYTLNAASQLTSKIAIEVGYVGSQGRHLFNFRDLNQFNNVDGRKITCANGKSIGYEEQCYPTYSVGNFTDIALWYVNQIETSSLSNYNSLQSTLKLQNFHGLTSTLNYTWAHSIDTASDGLDFVPNAAMPDDSFNPHAERANSNFDIRNRIQWFWTYNLPKVSTARLLTNGWALDGVLNYASGQPYTVSFIGENDLNGSGEYVGRMDIVGNPHKGAHKQYLLDASAFAVPCAYDAVNVACTGNQHPGSEGRNAFRSSDFTNFDFSLTKTTHLREKLTMELRADVFNILNHTNFSNPLLPGFGMDYWGNQDSTGKYLMTTATPDVGSGNPYLGGGGPRSLQLAAHFNF